MICNLEDGKSASAEIYDTEAKHVVTVTAVRSGNTITVNATESGKTFTVSVAGTDKKITMSGTQAVIEL